MKHTAFNEILKNTDRSLIEVYLELQVEYEKVYGKNTVVVMEVGSFFEVYGVDNEKETIGKPKEIGDLLNLQLTRKNKSIPENSVKNPLLVGFPTATFDRYMSKIVQEQKYTIVIVRQKGLPPNVLRYVDTILSPGVHVDYCLDSSDNFAASIVIDKQNSVYSAGYAAIDVTTGKSYVLEAHCTKEDPTFVLDELFHQLQARSTTEIIITCLTSEIDVEEIKRYLELYEGVSVKEQNTRLKISYQNELFKQTYEIQSFLTPIEFLDLEKRPLASEALALLIEFVVEHDHTAIQNIEVPKMLENNSFLYLGNNALKQLNIISTDKDEYTVLKMFDKTVTSVGGRLFKERLLNPIVNKNLLEDRYNMSDALVPVASDVRSELRNVYDIERIIRRISIGRLHPFEINFLYDSLVSARSISDLITKEVKGVKVPELLEQNSYIENAIKHIEKTFDLDASTKIAQKDIKKSFFCSGVDHELDILLEQVSMQWDKLTLIRTSLLELIEKTTGKVSEDFVQIKQLDKEGHYIHLTKSRFFSIEEPLREQFISIDGTVYACSDFVCKVQTTNVKITAPIIDTISEEIIVLQNKITALVKELYTKQLDYLAREYSPLLSSISNALAKIDVALSNVETSKEFNLVRPNIVETDEPILEIHNLRHPLVEQREQNGIYVPNDILLGEKTSERNSTLWKFDDEIRGVLLYGINSSGKSSLMKSLGVTVILAQSGMYVPAEHMTYSIVKELFTRIVSADNIEKGLSSFAVEMMELKNIFNRCTKHSLVLGDEISHGTETLSAIAIVTATIKQLHNSGSLFLFTTHLHQLQTLSHIKHLPNIASLHLSVEYNKETDTLTFDRNLQKGSGSSVYGLEFAQSLHMDETFIREALKIRRELAGDQHDIELLTKKQLSKYHNDVYLISCGVCGSEVDDTHHIREQHTANEDGHIDHFHKDHKYNLLPLCKSCHDKVHHGDLKIEGFVMTSNGIELKIEEK